MIMRKRLFDLLKQHGEEEVTHAQKAYVIAAPSEMSFEMAKTP